jgi:hypothetical protein
MLKFTFPLKMGKPLLTYAAGVDSEAAAACGGGVAGAASPFPSVSSSRKSDPTTTVSSSPAKYFLMIPESGDVISTVTLSVSILAITSSALMNSPGPIHHK